MKNDGFVYINQHCFSLYSTSFHVGSGCSTSHYYIKNIELAKKVFDAGSEEGIDMNILDIGGGFSGRMGTEDIFLQVIRFRMSYWNHICQ